MITAVDTNVILDVLLRDEIHGPPSREWLRDAYDRGAVLVCDIVYAELVPSVRDRAALDRALLAMGAQLSPIDTEIAWGAGIRWQRYREAAGPRQRIMTDFLIGAHALAAADAFLTRDQGFYATYFPELSTPVGPD